MTPNAIKMPATTISVELRTAQKNEATDAELREIAFNGKDAKARALAYERLEARQKALDLKQ